MHEIRLKRVYESPTPPDGVRLLRHSLTPQPIPTQGSEGAAAFAAKCKEWLQTENVTLLFAAKNQQENHALVLAAWLRRKIAAL